jgi:hypothetical protein
MVSSGRLSFKAQFKTRRVYTFLVITCGETGLFKELEFFITLQDFNSH